MITVLSMHLSSSMDNNKNPVVVNYSSSSYGRPLIRSPNSPPPSPSLSPPRSIVNLCQLFLSSSPHQYLPPSSTRSLLPIPMPHAPPLLPLPTSRRLFTHRGKRKAKNAAGTRTVITSKGECPDAETSAYIMSPPPSSLPLPKFSLLRQPKAVGVGTVGVGAGSCIADAAVVGGGADKFMSLLHI